MRLLAALSVLIALAGAPLAAQQDTLAPADGGAEFPIADASSPILTVDLERLFQLSQFGEAILATYNEERSALAAENREIAEALRVEELDLAERRPAMDPAVFQAEAAAFDEKAQAIRRAQDAKEEAIDAGLTEAREEFLSTIQPILGDILIERRASVILHQQTILLSLNRIDITDEAIARIDQQLGDGSAVTPDN